MSNFEERLTNIKGELSKMRDKAVSAKTIQEQSEIQIKNLVESIISYIRDDDVKTAVKTLSDDFLNDIGNTDKAAALFTFIDSYTAEQEKQAINKLEEISALIDGWKEKLEQGEVTNNA